MFIRVFICSLGHALVRMRVRVRVRLRVRLRLRVRVSVYVSFVCVCVFVCVCMFFMILPRIRVDLTIGVYTTNRDWVQKGMQRSRSTLSGGRSFSCVCSICNCVLYLYNVYNVYIMCI